MKNNYHNILILEDSKSMNKIVKSIFDGLKEYRSFQAFSLKEAYEILDQETIDYIMLDVNLPDGSGYDIISKLEFSDCKIFVLTNENDKQFIQMSYQKGVVDYIVKDSAFFHKVKMIPQTIEKLEANKKRNILIVDDSLVIREQLKHIFNNRFYNVEALNDTKDILKIIENKKIDLILLDIELEDENGIEFLAKHKNTLVDIKKIPIIIVSGYIDKFITQQSIKAGAVDVVKKPYVIEEIVLKVDLWIDYKRSHENLNDLTYQHELIQKQNDEFQVLLDATMEMIVIFDNQYNIINTNKVALDIFGFDTLDDIIGKSFIDFIDEDDKDIFYQQVELNDGKNYELIINNDERLYTLAKNKPITLHNKDLNILTMIDITELKTKDKHLMQQNRLAQMGEMISMIAHQWRQPLNTLSMINNNLLLKYRLKRLTDTIMKQFQEESHKQLVQMSNTINDFRNFFKPNKDLELLNMTDVINKTLDLFRAIAQSYDIKIILDIKKDITIQGYPNELGQAIINILNNAKDALIENNIENKFIKIVLYQVQNSAVVSIEDNAGGINEKYIKKIFDPYFSTKDEKNGTGLGLYMTKMIVQDHMQGDIQVKNKADGVMFKLIFPLKFEDNDK